MIVELGKVSVFNALNDKELGEVTQFCRDASLADGEVLISEHETGSSDLFVLCKGSVEVVSNDSAITSNEVTLSKLDKDIFGEVGWLCEGNRSATVRAVGPIEVIRIDGVALKNYLFNKPDIGIKVIFNIAQTLAKRLNNTDSLLKQVLWNTGF